MFGRGCKSSEGPSGARAQPALSTPPPHAVSPRRSLVVFNSDQSSSSYPQPWPSRLSRFHSAVLSPGRQYEPSQHSRWALSGQSASSGVACPWALLHRMKTAPRGPCTPSSLQRVRGPRCSCVMSTVQGRRQCSTVETWRRRRPSS